jgi:hypothetical protein
MSGIGLVFGWKCMGGTLTAVFDGIYTLAVPYGSSRDDTKTQCGDADNGFGLLVNYNLLGDGQHMVELFDNGVKFAEATFAVSTFGGEETLLGASRTLTTGFGGCRTTLSWQESQQNFVIADTDTCFQPLLGQWEFVIMTPGSDERDHYQFEQIVPVVDDEETEVIIGTDLDHNDVVILARTEDIFITPVEYDFFAASLDSDIRCEAFFLNQVGPNTVQGIGASYPADPVSGCQEVPSPLPAYPMTGTRTGAALSEQQALEAPFHTKPQTQKATPEETRQAFRKLLEKVEPLLLPPRGRP